MSRFLCVHTVPSNAFTREQVRELTQAAQQDPEIRGYRSFLNLSEGKIACIMEGPSREAVMAWFDKMGVPYDWVAKVELEGERGNILEEGKGEQIGQTPDWLRSSSHTTPS